MSKVITFVAVLALALSLTACRSTNSPAAGTNTVNAGEFATGHYRDLFVEDGHSQVEVDAKINNAFQQLFHGNPTNQAVYFPAGTNANGPLAYVKDIGDNDVRSEGMSYGMMIAVQLNKKKEFDAIWNWAWTFMYHSSANAPANPAYGYFSWDMKPNGTPNDEMPAPDGEQYFAMALYFASGRWGNGPGIYNYHAAADQILTDLIHRKIITGRTVTGVRTVGAIFDPQYEMVRFTPVTNHWNHTDPSYQLPAFYKLWALWGPEQDQPFWERAAAASRNFFWRAANSATGLTPDYANFDGTPWAASWKPDSTNFLYDAWRTAMNWSMDWAWWHQDVQERELSDRLQAFFESKGMTNYSDRFTLNGQPIGNDHSAGLVAMNAVASLAATNNLVAAQFVAALWNTPVPTGRWRYYNGMLYMLGMLHCSGEFRIWPPK